MFNYSDQIKVVDRIDHLTHSLSDSVIDALYTGDAGELMLESVTLEDIENTFAYGFEEMPAMMLEAIKAKAAQLSKRMLAFSRALGQQLKPIGLTVVDSTIGKPKKSGAVAIQVAKLTLSDDQSISLVFHAPDNDPLKIKSDDTLIAFRFLLNSRDVTHVVAPTGGKDISLKQAALALSNVAERNMAKFAKANADKKAQQAELDSIQAQIEQLETDTATQNGQIDKLEPESEKLDTRINSLNTQLENERSIQAELQAQLASLSKVTPPAPTATTAATSNDSEVESKDSQALRKINPTKFKAGSVYEKEHLTDLTTIAKRIRTDIKNCRNDGTIPKSVKIGIKKGTGKTLDVTLKDLGDDIRLFADSYLSKLQENPSAQHVYTPGIRNLIQLVNGLVSQYNYDHAENAMQINVNFYGGKLEVDYDLSEHRKEVELQQYLSTHGEPVPEQAKTDSEMLSDFIDGFNVRYNDWSFDKSQMDNKSAPSILLKSPLEPYDRNGLPVVKISASNGQLALTDYFGHPINADLNNAADVIEKSEQAIIANIKNNPDLVEQLRNFKPLFGHEAAEMFEKLTASEINDNTGKAEFWYGLRARPYGMATTPPVAAIKVLDHDEAVAKFGDLGASIRHGAIGYAEKLSESQVKAFELVDLDKLAEVVGDDDTAYTIMLNAIDAYSDSVDHFTESDRQALIEKVKAKGFKSTFIKQLREQNEFKFKRSNDNAFQHWNASIDLIDVDDVIDQLNQLSVDDVSADKPKPGSVSIKGIGGISAMPIDDATTDSILNPSIKAAMLKEGDEDGVYYQQGQKPNSNARDIQIAAKLKDRGFVLQPYNASRLGNIYVYQNDAAKLILTRKGFNTIAAEVDEELADIEAQRKSSVQPFNDESEMKHIISNIALDLKAKEEEAITARAGGSITKALITTSNVNLLKEVAERLTATKGTDEASSFTNIDKSIDAINSIIDGEVDSPIDAIKTLIKADLVSSDMLPQAKTDSVSIAIEDVKANVAMLRQGSQTLAVTKKAIQAIAGTLPQNLSGPLLRANSNRMGKKWLPAVNEWLGTANSYDNDAQIVDGLSINDVDYNLVDGIGMFGKPLSAVAKQHPNSAIKYIENHGDNLTDEQRNAFVSDIKQRYLGETTAAVNPPAAAPSNSTEQSNDMSEETMHMDNLKALRDYKGEATLDKTMQFQDEIESAYDYFEKAGTLDEHNDLLEEAFTSLVKLQDKIKV